MSDAALMRLVRSIVADDPAALNLLASNPGLARAHFEVGATRQSAKAYHLDEVGHYIYAGDTALHLAAAAYREKTARKLMAMGAEVRSRNRRGAEPLHYAADGLPGTQNTGRGGSGSLEAKAQQEQIVQLLHERIGRSL